MRLDVLGPGKQSVWLQSGLKVPRALRPPRAEAAMLELKLLKIVENA